MTILDRDLFDLLDHTADAAVAFTEAGEICAWNPGSQALFGYSRDEVIGRTCFELFRGSGSLGARVCGEQCHVLECAAHHTPIADFDLEVKARSGDPLWVNLSTLVHHDHNTGRRRIVHFARSIAERKRAEALMGRIRRLSKQLVEVADDSPRPAPVARLSDQERRVLKSLSEGKNPAAIVAELHISPQTLRNHLHHINHKLGTHTRLEAVIHATRRRLI